MDTPTSAVGAGVTPTGATPTNEAQVPPEVGPTTVGGAAPTLATLAERYVVTHRNTKDSQRAGRLVLGAFVRVVGDVEPHAITRDAVERWWSTVAVGRRPASRRAYYATARSFLTWLRAAYPSVGDHLASIPKPRAPQPTARTISPDELDAIRAACETSRDRAMVEAAYGLGLRCIEMAALDVGDIDWSARTVIVRGKGERVDILPLPQRVEDALRAYLDEHPQADGPLFRRFVDGAPLQNETVSRRFAKLTKLAGVKRGAHDGRGAHALRRTRATDLLDAGATLRQVQGLLRHQSLATTEAYLRRASVEELRGLLDA